MVDGSLITVYGLWFMVHGVWFIDYGLWCTVHGLWIMDYDNVPVDGQRVEELLHLHPGAGSRERQQVTSSWGESDNR